MPTHLNHLIMTRPKVLNNWILSSAFFAYFLLIENQSLSAQICPNGTKVRNQFDAITGLANETYTMIIACGPTETTTALPIDYSSSSPNKTIVISDDSLSSPGLTVFWKRTSLCYRI